MSARRRIGTNDEFWESVQERLDARIDPLDDVGIREWALDHPEVLEELASLRWGLGRIERDGSVGAEAGTGRRWRPLRRRAGAWAAAAVLLLAAGITLYALPGRDERSRGVSGKGEIPSPGGRSEEAVSVARPSGSRILWYRVTETTRTGRSWVRHVSGTHGRRTDRSIVLEPVRISDGIARVGPTHIRTTVERSGWR